MYIHSFNRSRLAPGRRAVAGLILLVACGRSPDETRTERIRQDLSATFIQLNYATPQTPLTAVAVKYTAAQRAGNANVVVVGWNDTAAQVVSVTDTMGNAYTRAIGPTTRTTTLTQSIYYAAGIASAAASANTVTVTFNQAATWADVRILEYAGIDPANPVDVTSGRSGSGLTSSTLAVTTTNASDLLVSANMVTSYTQSAGTGWTKRTITDPDGDLVQDRSVTATGAYTSTAPLNGGADWIMQMVAFRTAGSPPTDSQPPTNPSNLTANASSSSQIDLGWTASTDNVGVTGYRIERCAGAGCANFAQVGTSTGTTFSSTGLSTSTSYSFRVRAADAAGNLSGYSNVASATTLGDTTPPTNPSNLTATAASTTQINLSWTASTDAAGVTGYLVESCQGSGCTSFTQIATVAGTTYNDTGLRTGTTYGYRVRATDAAGNLSGFSNTASATTPAPDTTPPTNPSSLAASAVSTTQINLSWTSSTDDVAVTAYLVERCQGSGCSNYAQIASVSGTTFNNTGLLPSTPYGYRVRATDAAGNLSGYSNAVSATTLTPDTTPPTNPSGLTAAALSSSQINLAWNASTDDTGVTAYLIERCQAAGCSNFAQIATSSGTSYSDTTLSASIAYSYRVRARDAANNLSGYSNVASATTPAPSFVPTFQQGNYATPQSGKTSVVVSYDSAQWAGDTNVVVVGWNDSDVQVNSVTDTKGNAYSIAIGPTVIPGLTQAIYYANAIASANASENKVTVAFSGSAQYADIRILEYRGLAPGNPVDAAVAATGTASDSDSGTLTTTNGSDLLVAANIVQSVTNGPGPGYTSRMLTVPDGDIVEDRLVSSTGTYNATAPLGSAGAFWIMQLVAFKAASTPPPADTIPPIVTLTSPAAGATLSGTVTVTFTASDAQSGIEGTQGVVDGVPASPVDNTGPYSVQVDTTGFSNGVHMLSASAMDSARNVGYAPAIQVTFSNTSPGNPAVTGLFSGTTSLPIVPVHMAQLPAGKILMWDGQGVGFDGRTWDPAADKFNMATIPINAFCTGHEQMADGRIIVVGGHNGGAHLGLTAAVAFDPASSSWSVLPDMAFPRWYPTATTLPDGRIFVVSGESNCPECFVPVSEIYSPATNSWTRLTTAPFTFPYYPHSFVLPDGRLMVAATSEDPIVSQIFDLNTLTWTAVGGPQVDGGSTAMYRPGKFLKVGTSTDPDDITRPSQTTAYVLDATQPSPNWRQVSSMQYARTYHTLTILPDGNVLVTGGGPTTAPTDTGAAIRPVELWSPSSETWTTLGSMSAPRLYHSEALLMPDARVLIMGGGRFDDSTLPTDQFNAEFYAPPYLFKGPRPVIRSAPAQIQLGQTFVVQTPDAARIASVALMRFASVTHTINMAQRYLPLAFTAGSGSLTVTAPANANLATPGNYMLFLVDTNGVPSIAANTHL
ncbi:MAG TPA: fibronectin type III domain-containing protein [Myxococcales bacterium]|nr:fibronectin type III domain-containing protein [Myxococcales bacterium]